MARTTIPRARLTTVAMVTGGERKHPIVVIDGHRKQWVGFGWVDEGEATAEDYERYPVMVEDET